MKQNNPCYLFGMYEPDTDSVIVNAINDTYTGTPLSISCKKYNSSVVHARCRLPARQRLPQSSVPRIC